MWISRKSYENILSSLNDAQNKCEKWEAKYHALSKNRDTVLSHEIVFSLKTLEDLFAIIDFYKDRIQYLESELYDFKETYESKISYWKQKYADEVEKRLQQIE